MNAPHERTGALKAALEYAKRGWPVFQTFIQDGKLLPASAAKDGGPRWDATTDPKEIKRRWTIKPNAGVAIATGRTAGILVVDIDTMKGHGEDGYASLAELEASNGLIPDSLYLRPHQAVGSTCISSILQGATSEMGLVRSPRASTTGGMADT